MRLKCIVLTGTASIAFSRLFTRKTSGLLTDELPQYLDKGIVKIV